MLKFEIRFSITILQMFSSDQSAQHCWQRVGKTSVWSVLDPKYCSLSALLMLFHVMAPYMVIIIVIISMFTQQ